MNTGPLRQALDNAMTETGLPMKKLTVMSEQADPFRLDTPANHRDGRWLAETATTLGLAPEPLLDSGWSFTDATRRLMESRAYRNGSTPDGAS